ncbi:MAG: hypothetical protein ABIZ70_02065 [Gemmatimonadales bacterium]
MPRPWSHRLVASFFALWLSLVGLEGSLAPCPMHQMAEQSADPSAMPGMAMGLASGGAAATPDGSGHEAEPGHHSHRCGCPGSGCATPVGDLPTALLAIHARYLQVEAPQFNPAARDLVLPDFLLPFATAPPDGSLS